MIKSHETELEGQLNDLADTRLYRNMLEDVRRKAAAQTERRKRRTGAVRCGRRQRKPEAYLYACGIGRYQDK